MSDSILTNSTKVVGAFIAVAGGIVSLTAYVVSFNSQSASNDAYYERRITAIELRQDEQEKNQTQFLSEFAAIKQQLIYISRDVNLLVTGKITEPTTTPTQ